MLSTHSFHDFQFGAAPARLPARAWSRGAVVVLTLGLGGCTGAIMNTFDVERGDSITTGARQRIVFTKVKHPEPQSQRVVCAEPSPDVATALANSFGLGASVISQGSGTVTSATAESMAQLAERTATIQLLRDALYRACEAYANGAVTKASYAIILSGIDDVMVTLLGSEFAAGAFGRSLAGADVAASATATAAIEKAAESRAAVDAAAERLESAQADVEVKRKALATAQDEERTAREELRIQERALADARASADEGATPPDTTARDAAKTALDEKEAARINARRELDRAEESLADAGRLLRDSASARASALAEKAVVTAAGDIQPRGGAEVAAQIHQMQREFIRAGNLSAVMTACITELSERDPLTKKSLLTLFCEQRLGELIDLTKEIAKLRSETDLKLRAIEARHDSTVKIVALARDLTALVDKTCDKQGDAAMAEACDKLRDTLVAVSQSAAVEVYKQ